MRIAVISTMLAQPWAGSEELWADMVKVAVQEGHEVEVSVWSWPSVPRQIVALQELGAKVTFRSRPSKLKGLYKIAGQRLPWLRLPYPERLSAFRAMFRRRPDVILLSQGWVYEFPDNPDLLKRIYSSDIPLVVVNQSNFEGVIDEKLRRETRAFSNRAARIAFVAEGNLKAAERQLAMDLPQGVVVRNPVNLVDTSIVPWPKLENPQTWNLACVGRLDCANKSQDVLLEALSAPVWQQRPWKLRFFGSGVDKEYIQDLIAHYGLNQHVEFAGHVSDVREIWKNHHLMVLPSRLEGTPLAMVEAMLCGRPTLVTSVAGYLEWVDDEQTGFVADAPNAFSIGKALERAWQQRDQWQQMGFAAHESAREKYDPAPGKALLRILEESVSNPKK